MTYNAATTGAKSYEEAIQAIRYQGIVSGKYKPLNDQEQEAARHWARDMNAETKRRKV